MKARDYSKLSTATLVKIQGRSAAGSAEERVIRDELRGRGEDAAPRPGLGRKQPLLFDKQTWSGTREKERV